jgi:hypothetical protein
MITSEHTMSNECIFCGGSGPFLTREHILPESLGGDDSLVLRRQCVCDRCQNYFGSKVESIALNNYPFSHWRTFGGILTKKGKIPFFDDVEGTVFGPDESGASSIAFNPVFLKSILEGKKTQMRLLSAPSNPIYVCRFLLKMGLELLHEDGVDNALHDRYNGARRFARICQPGSKWWFGLAKSEVAELPIGLAINDVNERDFVFSISNGQTMLFTPILSTIILDGSLTLSGVKIHTYQCKC